MKYAVSEQALALIAHLKEFNYEDFFEWYELRTRTVGTSYVLEYIRWREENGKSK